jgi:hypothetical protein
MRTAIICALTLLMGCTHIPVKVYSMPDAPADLMQAPQDLSPIPTNPDGSADPKIVLNTAIGNNTKSLQNSIELLKLQTWILQTQKNIQQGGQTK